MDALAVLDALALDQAPDDATRARLLAAVRAYGQACQWPELAHEAQARWPKADPFQPPTTWAEAYHGGFESGADEDCGTYAENSGEYVDSYWQGLTDAQRQERLGQPQLGWADGHRDAEAMNAV